MITTLLLLPTATALLLVLALPRAGEKVQRITALFGSLATLGIALALLSAFDPSVPGFQPRWTEKHAWVPAIGVSYHVGIDGISLFLVVLTAFLTPLGILCSWRSVSRRVLEFHAALLFLETGMLGVFVALDLVLFYVFWEVVLIPMYLLIGIWGSENRVYAAVKFLVYTVVGSLLMFLAILYLYAEVAQRGAATFDIEKIRAVLNSQPLDPSTQMTLFLAFALAFAIKVPIFPLHTWLPDAHTEAPTAGSVILAGILLKMGCYGFVRFAIPFFPAAAQASIPWLSALSVIGIIAGACLCMVQEDMKRLVAYSSVSHLGFVMLGVFSLRQDAVVGGVLQMVNHGLSTGALFLLVGMLYERRHSRKISEYGGIAPTVPRLATAFVVTTLSSIGLPGLNGFIGEFMILVGAFEWNRGYTVLAATGIVLGAVYMLILCRRLFFGEPTHAEEHGMADLDSRELGILIPIVLLMVAIGLFSPWFTDRIAPSVAEWLEQLPAALRTR